MYRVCFPADLRRTHEYSTGLRWAEIANNCQDKERGGASGFEQRVIKIPGKRVRTWWRASIQDRELLRHKKKTLEGVENWVSCTGQVGMQRDLCSDFYANVSEHSEVIPAGAENAED